jgi:hypothetical protein
VSFTPADARELHRRLADWWGSAGAQLWHSVADAYARSEGDAGYFFQVDPPVEQRRLQAAETFLVTAEMAAVCRVAGRSLPELRVTTDLLPASCGVLLFDDDLAGHDPAIVQSKLVTWGPAAYGGKPGVAVASYLLPGQRVPSDDGQADLAAAIARVFADIRGPALPSLWTFLPYGVEIPAEAVSDQHLEHLVRMVLASWLLMGQPLAARDRPVLNRADTKRATRSGLTGALTVVMLRYQPTAPEGPSGRVYHRRWLVRGHWRRLPSGRPTWVHEHVKGPAGAPLVLTDKVTVLAR